jgi:ABC-type multidrug transport system fused ATPase/permease subunit
MHVACAVQVRAYGAQPRFRRVSELRLELNLRAALLSQIANCWLGLRLELLGAALAAAATILAFARNTPAAPPPAAAAAAAAAAAVFGPPTEEMAKAAAAAAAEAAQGAAAAAAGAAAKSASRVGRSALAVSLAMQVTQALNWSVRQATELEANLVAVERMRTYRNVPPEAGYDAPPTTAQAGTPADSGAMGGDANELSSPSSSGRPLADNAAAAWDAPAQGWRADGVMGRIELHDVGMRYRDDLPNVLSGVHLSIAPAEKVGVVGRTGSGKSSLLMALTRLVAPPLRSGLITLDGVDIASLPLQPYRSAICVIPQEPTLFEGTVRCNCHACMPIRQKGLPFTPLTF